jgi:FkbM family methyltransferase
VDLAARVTAAGNAARMLKTYQNWPTAFANRLQPEDPSRSVVYRLRSGAVFEMDRGPHGVKVINLVWGNRIYQPSPSFVPQQGWVVLDIGAHKGTFTIQAARCGARVVAVEPAEYNLRRLRRNVELNQPTEVQVVESAVTEKGGTISMVLDAANSGQGHVGAEVQSTAVEVPSCTLEDVLEAAGTPEVDLMKMDIEGAERDILLGSSEAVIRRIRRMVLEYHPEQRPAVATAQSLAAAAEPVGKKLVATLEEVGYDCSLRREHTLLDASRR